MAAIESIKDMEVPMLLPGITVAISKDDHGPIKGLQMMRFDGSSWQLIGDMISAR
jgi:branched-chain amino acid transport system substrate-binding protein